MILFDHARLVVLSRKSYEFDGHAVAYSIHERATGRLIGHVARALTLADQWVYLLATEPRQQSPVGETWTLAGWSRADAVDHLLSAFSPCGIFTGELV